MFAEMMFVKYSDKKLIMWVLEGTRLAGLV